MSIQDEIAVKGVKEGGAICLVALHPTHQISRLQTFHAHLFTKCSQSPSEVLPQHASAMFLWKQVLYLATTPWRSVPELWLPLHKTLKTRILAKYKQRSCQTFHNFQHSLLLTVPPCPVQLWLSQTIKSRSSLHLSLPPGWQLRGFWKTQCFEGSPVWRKPLIINIDCQNHNPWALTKPVTCSIRPHAPYLGEFHRISCFTSSCQKHEMI